MKKKKFFWPIAFFSVSIFTFTIGSILLDNNGGFLQFNGTHSVLLVMTTLFYLAILIFALGIFALIAALSVRKKRSIFIAAAIFFLLFITYEIQRNHGQIRARNMCLADANAFEQENLSFRAKAKDNCYVEYSSKWTIF